MPIDRTMGVSAESVGAWGARARVAPSGRRVAPAAVGQASLWFLRQVMPYKSPYNIAVQFRLVGELDADVVASAFREIARRHESCRTTFATVDGTVVRIVHDTMPADVAIVDVASTADPGAEAETVARALACDAFDLERGALVRVRVIRLGAREHLLVVVMDHIVADGMSLGVIWRELEALYRALLAGEASPLPPPKKQQCVDAQNAWLESAPFTKHLEFWKKHLTGAAPCDLPTDRPRPPIKSYRGGTTRTRIPPALVERLDALTKAEGVSLFSSVLAGLDVLLARYSGQSDISVLVPVACRNRFAAEEVIGYFANVVVLRNEVPDDLSFRALMKAVSAEVYTGLLRQDVPFERVIAAIRPERSLSHDPLASVGLSFLPGRGSRLDLPGVVATYEEIPNGGSKFDLHFFMAEVEGGLTVTAEYNSDIFDRETIERLDEHYVVLLEAIARDPSATIAALPLMGEAERRRVLVEWNETASDYPRGSSVASLVEAAARRSPQAIAASFEGETLTYAELSRRSNQVARCLQARGVVPGSLVGIAVERSLSMIVALLGVWKAGGAYVPLDPAYPRDRLSLMASDSGLGVLVTESALVGIVDAASTLRLDGDREEISAQSDAALDVALDPEAIAYVIYTSGSTGKPKGVEVPHRAVANFLTSMAARPGLTAEDRLLAVTSLSFDIAGLELWLPLTVGARIELASRATASSGEALRARVETGDITVLQATPTTFRLLLESGWKGTPGLKVLIGGEAVPRELAEQLVDRAASVWNMYGPTETTIWSCVQRLEKNAPALIGRPIANTQVYVLDRNLEPVPPGVTGEIYIGGDGVARGYLGRPELTAARFVRDPFSQRPGARMYRTGDLGRFRADGALDYQGRNDFQVKIRGYRIELGEIEANLSTHPAVREAVVVAYEEAAGEQSLVGYITSDAPPAFEELQAHLRAKLPEYMVPARFVVLDRLPLTANNKIDRKALPRPDRATVVASRDGGQPRDAVERRLKGIWEELLRRTDVGVNESFFDLGGHSLLALKLFDRIAGTFGVTLPIASLFQAPTIAALGQLLRRKGWAPSWSSLVPIQTSGTRLPFFCIHAVGGNVLNYRLLSEHLGPDVPFYGLQSRGLGGNEPPHTTVQEMAAAYIAEMKQERPTGPYQLGGSSSGGIIAYEMAQQLHAAGEQVSTLVFFDTQLLGMLPPRLRQAHAASPLHRSALRFDHHFGHLLLRNPRQGLQYLAGRARARLGGVDGPVGQAVRSAAPAIRHVIEANLRAIRGYVPDPYPGSAVMLLSRDEPHRAFYDGRLAWADLLGQGLNVRFIQGDHDTMLDEPAVGGVADVLGRCLA